MDGTIRGLCCHKLVERVPGHSLNVMAVLSNLADQLTCTIQLMLGPSWRCYGTYLYAH